MGNKEYLPLEQNCRVFSKSLDVDLDFQETVPAYLDDIYRVVKCHVKSCITSADITFNEVKIFGKTEICLTYYNENSNLCYADFEEEFNRSITVDGVSEQAFAVCDIDDKYANFRVINQRRIDIHTASVLRVEVYDKCGDTCLSALDGAKMKSETHRLSCVVGANISKIEFDEEFTIPSDSPMIRRVVSASAYACLTETKVIKDKAFIKGTVNVSVLYTVDTDDENVMKAEHSFAVSRIVDIAGIDDNDIFITRLSVGSIFIKAKVSAGDKMNAINTYGEVIANSVVLREKALSVVTDGYVLGRHSACSYTEVNVCSAGKLYNDNKQYHLQFDLNSDIKEIKDLSLNITAPVMKGNKLVSAVNMNGVSLTDNDELCSLSFSKEIELETFGYESAVASIGIVSFDYRISGDTLELRLNTGISAYFYNNRRLRLLSDMEAGEATAAAPSLTVYFGKSNENVWDIAKRFSSDSERIVSENALQSDVLDTNRILMIPRA